jgi:hypothetical protein
VVSFMTLRRNTQQNNNLVMNMCEELLRKAKFRVRSSAVWCPKVYKVYDQTKMTDEQRQQILEQDRPIVEKWNQYLNGVITIPPKEPPMIEGIPTKDKRTGWQNMGICEVCEFCLEFDLDNNGVFCLYGIKNR